MLVLVFEDCWVEKEPLRIFNFLDIVIFFVLVDLISGSFRLLSWKRSIETILKQR